MASHVITDSIIDPVLLLRDLIHQRTGLFFPDYQGLEVLAAKLRSRLEHCGCKSLLEYYRLLSDPGAASTNEWLHVVAALSKGKSSFFRHKYLAQSLVDVVIPQWVSEGFTEPLRIWSAGCSTGEEPLTIAMGLTESGWIDRIHIELHGSDANFVAVEKARRGVFVESRMMDLSPELRFKYFTPVDGGWRAKPEIQKRIQWSVTNLMSESEIAEFATSHIIVCRNVFIYFSASAIYQTLRILERQMPAGGYLFTDGGEYFKSLMSQVSDFKRQQIGGASIWRKRIESAG